MTRRGPDPPRRSPPSLRRRRRRRPHPCRRTRPGPTARPAPRDHAQLRPLGPPAPGPGRPPPGHRRRPPGPRPVPARLGRLGDPDPGRRRPGRPRRPWPSSRPSSSATPWAGWSPSSWPSTSPSSRAPPPAGRDRPHLDHGRPLRHPARAGPGWSGPPDRSRPGPCSWASASGPRPCPRVTCAGGSTRLGFGADAPAAQVRFVEAMHRGTPSRTLADLIPSLATFDLSARLGALDLPVLVVVGSHDKLTAPRLARRMAGGPARGPAGRAAPLRSHAHARTPSRVLPAGRRVHGQDLLTDPVAHPGRARGPRPSAAPAAPWPPPGPGSSSASGTPTADLMFIGEGPGRDEDLAGEPFVGRSGKLLDKLVHQEIGLDRVRASTSPTW